MYSLPRGDLQVSVDNITLSPALALDSWVAFYGMDGDWMLMGDLVLQPGELLTAEAAALREGLEITAIHNTLAGEQPQVFDLHLSGSGDPERLARSIEVVLKAANVTVGSPGGQTGTVPRELPEKGTLDSIMSANGTYEDGALQYRLPRAEMITEKGMPVPPSLDVATVIKLQPLPDQRAALAGEFVLTAPEVEPVISSLSENWILVTATHSHMLEEQPRLFYLHVWAVDDQLKLARGTREALNRTNAAR